MTKRAPTHLTVAEFAVLRLIAEGMTIQEVADARTASIKTVKAQLEAIYGKLGARNRAHAVAIAIRGGFIR
jgi:DNA-binding CsgD family transcriptional regulator